MAIEVSMDFDEFCSHNAGEYNTPEQYFDTLYSTRKNDSNYRKHLQHR
jgi:hypothetical protein